MSLSLKDIAAHGHVRRWHTARVRREQTLGEHVGLVAMIAMELHSIMMSDEASGFTYCPEQRGFLALAALHHDAPETLFGDTPSPAKSHFLQRQGFNMDRATEEDFWSRRSTTPPLSNIQGHLGEILRHADLLEAWLFFRQEGLDSEKMRAIQLELDAAHSRVSPSLKKASLLLVNRYLREVA